ncbi:type II secretion system protein GspL [Acinetobacter schindleri]|uniref:type II secretion system protein GspL n=1 Tax=Acinetobacter TaxID=469 RepID=UPI0021CD438E|nr:type II secretion system protein GspL [Acinetobacter schindleri]MCU4520926.1 type II secretion system protein GspL [Acinetobacter schindleri]MDP1445279.1 type II secretion system protein GspL [Acinetobacter schindleri]
MLYLWMPEANGVWQWSDGEFWKSADTLEQLIQEIQGQHGVEATVFFPSRHVQILQQSMSKVQYKKMGQEAIKYLLEEYVILPVDAMKVLHHFQQPDQLSVLGISNSTVETMQHVLTLLPVKVTALLPDFLVLPVPEENQRILAELAGRLLVRESEYVGHSVDDLSLYLDYQPKDVNYKVSNLNDAQLRSLEAVVTHDQVESFQYSLSQLKKAKQHPFNVLPKAKSDTPVSGYWKACAAVFLGILVLQFSYDAVRWYQYKKIANQTASQAIDQFKYWFGQNYPVNEQNIKSQFEGQMRLSQVANTQAFDLISRVGPVLMQNQIIAQRVSYDTSSLNMDLQANSSDALSTLTRQLTQQGFKVELGNVQANGTGAIGSVRIQ